jgi:superfamily II DNA/RNA helicase
MEKQEQGWNQFNLPPGIVSSINRLGWKQPTPIQLESIPYSLQGKDIIGIAQVGIQPFNLLC